MPLLMEFVQGEQRISDGTNVLTGGALLSGDGYAGIFAYGFLGRASLDGAAGPAEFSAGQLTHFEWTAPLIDTGSQQVALIDTSAQLQVQALPTDSSYTLLSGSRHADFGTDGILAWGRWIDGVSIFGTVEPYNSDSGLHYVVGLPTAVMPQTGSATYTMIGATSPTYSDGSSAPGTLSTSGTLSVVDWSTGAIGMNLNVSMPNGRGYVINGSAQIVGSAFAGNFFQGEGMNGTTQSSCLSGCDASVQGFFAGTSAERAGLGYRIGEFLDGKNIVGTAAFTKQ